MAKPDCIDVYNNNTGTGRSICEHRKHFPDELMFLNVLTLVKYNIILIWQIISFRVKQTMKYGLLHGCLVVLFFLTQIHLFLMFEPWWRRPKLSAGVLRMELHKPVGDVAISVSIFYVQSAQSNCRCACWSFALAALLHCAHAYPPPPAPSFVSTASCGWTELQFRHVKRL